MGKPIDLIGQRFGRLRVVAEGDSMNGRKTWICQCDCGDKKVISSAALRHGGVKSCGCLRKEANAQRAKSRYNPDAKRRDPLHKRWSCMIQRCENPKNPSWHNYGGRGIKVCARWRESYDDFFSDMGMPPSMKHTIERIDNDGDYAPDNCRWALRKEQLRNQRCSINVTINGVTMNARDWSESTGTSYQKITRAFRAGGIDAAAALIGKTTDRKAHCH